MSWSYVFSPYLWPPSVVAILIFALAWYSWHRRYMPGALAFAVACLFGAVWLAGSALESAAVELPAKVFWVKFQAVWQLPAITAITCFVLGYAGFGRWLTRRNLVLLAFPPLLFLALVLTNDFHHLVWRGFLLLDGAVQMVRGSANWIAVGYAYALAVVNIIVFIWLLVRFPQYRWPVTLMLFGQVFARVLYLMDAMNVRFLSPLEPDVSMLMIPFSMYAAALHFFHVLDPVPVARTAVLEQMQEGMLVLDLQGRIMDLNPAAGRILGESPAALRRRPAAELLPGNQGILEQPDETGMVQTEISLENGNDVRHYSLNITPLVDRHGRALGRLLLLHEVTEQRRTQSQLLEQQRVLATLKERDCLARELHDGVGQVLGYVSMQAQTVQKWVLSGDIQKAGTLLGRLAKVAQDAHADVRESILGLKAGPVSEWSFLPSLKQYLNDFETQYSIRTELVLSNRTGDDSLEPETGVQVLRVVQEAMANARKHGCAQTVRVSIDLGDGRAGITVADDGRGFDTGQLNPEAGGHYGLAFMRERMAQIGGSVKIDSNPGMGTIVKLDVPVRHQRGGIR